MARENITDYDDTLFLYTDCKPLVEKIHEPTNMYDDLWFERRENSLDALFSFEEYTVTWEEREASEENVRADRLSKEAMWQARGDKASGGNAERGVTFIMADD